MRLQSAMSMASLLFIEFMLSQIDKILDELSIQIDDNSVQISGNVKTA